MLFPLAASEKLSAYWEKTLTFLPRTRLASLVSALELLDDFAGNASDEADLLSLGNCGGYVSYHEGGFLRTEDNAGHIGRSVRKGIVHAGKVNIGVGGGGFHNSVRGRKTYSPAKAGTRCN